LVLKLVFPAREQATTSTLNNIKALASPLFLFMLICMTLTATTELGTQQWIERILGASGASPMLIMALITGLMAFGRYFAGLLIHKLNPAGVLLASAILASAGIYAMSLASGWTVYPAAILFALGVTYFWPTMLGFVAENSPQTGAIGLSVIGGMGMFAVSMWNPVIGSWIDDARAKALANTASATEAELQAGQAVLSNLTLFPLTLILAFTLLCTYLAVKKPLPATATN